MLNTHGQVVVWVYMYLCVCESVCYGDICSKMEFIRTSVLTWMSVCCVCLSNINPLIYFSEATALVYPGCKCLSQHNAT